VHRGTPSRAGIGGKDKPQPRTLDTRHQSISINRVYGLTPNPSTLSPHPAREAAAKTASAIATESTISCPANSAHTRQSGPDSGPGFRVKVLKTFQVVAFSLGSGSTPSRANSGGEHSLGHRHRVDHQHHDPRPPALHLCQCRAYRVSVCARESERECVRECV